MIRVRCLVVVALAMLVGGPAAARASSPASGDPHRWCVDVQQPTPTLTPDALVTGIRDGSITVTSVVDCAGLGDPADVKDEALELIRSHVIIRLEALAAMRADRTPVDGTDVDGAQATRQVVERAQVWAHDEAIWNSQYFTGAMEDQVLGLTGYVDAVRFAADLGELALADTDEGIAYLSFGGVIGGLMFDQLRYMRDRVKAR